MSDPRDRQYTNGDITVFWVPSKCIHATTCFRELIEVFNPGRRPWVNMEGAPTRRIIEVVNKCPTQAIVWKHNSDLSEEEKASQRRVAREEENPETLSGTGQLSDTRQITEQKTRVKPANVRIMKDGAIVVEGNFRVIGKDDETLKSTIMTSFCRCGNSRSMPYCDGTHRKIGFTDEST
jgi:CDGSH-type Zn-finger protein/uncharacterized Fe-S cluster protein YjdI